MSESENRKYNRKKRAKNKLCTVCGKPLDDDRFMLCRSCRSRQASYMRKRREKKSHYIPKKD